MAKFMIVLSSGAHSKIFIDRGLSQDGIGSALNRITSAADCTAASKAEKKKTLAHVRVDVN